MLDPEIPEERREQIASETRKRIESGGDLKQDTSWGMRKLAYEIHQRTEADYRFFRFETGGELLDELNHNLRIADGVLRFRIFKVDPDTPAIVPPAPLATLRRASPRGGRRRRAPEREAPADEAAEPAPAEATAEPAAARGPDRHAEEAGPAAGEDAEPTAEEPAAEEAPPRRAERSANWSAPAGRHSAGRRVLEAASCDFLRPGGENRRSRA